MGTIALRGPLGRPALTLSAAALGLATLAACGPHSPAAHARAGAGARTRPAASPVTGAALPGRPRRARPVTVGVLSATFVSARRGWALTVRSCHRPGCPRLALRETTDHGRHWFAVPQPPVPFAAPGTTPAPSAVASIRFAD